MRRVSASLLLALLCFGFALPFLRAQPNSMPACCRRDGKHHCSMSPSGDGFRTSAANCPYRRLTVLIPQSAPLKESPPVVAVSLSVRYLLPTDWPLVAQRSSGNTQKRGPPVSQFLSR